MVGEAFLPEWWNRVEHAQKGGRNSRVDLHHILIPFLGLVGFYQVNSQHKSEDPHMAD